MDFGFKRPDTFGQEGGTDSILVEELHKIREAVERIRDDVERIKNDVEKLHRATK